MMLKTLNDPESKLYRLGLNSTPASLKSAPVSSMVRIKIMYSNGNMI